MNKQYDPTQYQNMCESTISVISRVSFHFICAPSTSLLARYFLAFPSHVFVHCGVPRATVIFCGAKSVPSSSSLTPYNNCIILRIFLHFQRGERDRESTERKYINQLFYINSLLVFLCIYTLSLAYTIRYSLTLNCLDVTCMSIYLRLERPSPISPL